MKILITGAMGSGKTTQASLLADYLRVPFLGMGDLLREKVKEGLGDDSGIRRAFLKGTLVNDGLVARVFRKEVERLNIKKGFVVDGYPRSLHQLKLYDPGFDRVYYLSVPEDIAVQRLLDRGRMDDSMKIIKKRLQVFHELTQPVYDYFRKQGIFKKINGTGSVDEVQNLIRQDLNVART